MIGWNDYFFGLIIGATLLLSVLGLRLTAIMPGIDGWNKRFFRSFFIVLILNGCSSLADTAAYFYGTSTVIRFLQAPFCLLMVLPLTMLPVLLLHCCGENIRESRLLKAVTGLWIVYFCLVTCGLFTDAFFFVTPDRLARRGPWYPLMLLPVNGITVLNLAALIRRRKKLSYNVWRSFLISLLPMAVMIFVQLFVDVILLLGICYPLFALSMYSIITSDQIEQDMRYRQEILRQQTEIAHQRASVMVLQMRPHFIYNTMTSIYCLCSQDPEKAQQVVLDFTTYLRKNFTAVASAEPIPFTSELEHTRAYLAVEQAQHSKSLFVEYDTPHSFFRLPPLTLQPIVENAVKHGRDPGAGPLHISIRTRITASGSEITVSDNGRGYVPADDGEPHIALKNIRQRLAIMCGGNLTITPGDGGGTVVTVTIPSSASPKMNP